MSKEKNEYLKATTNPSFEISVSWMAYQTELNRTEVNVSCLPKWTQMKWKWLMKSIDRL